METSGKVAPAQTTPPPVTEAVGKGFTVTTAIPVNEVPVQLASLTAVTV